MNEFDYKERRFEEDIEASLINNGGYIKGNPSDFNREIALDEGTFVEFLKRSQPNLWERYEKIVQGLKSSFHLD